jgi:hypothetical protein
MVTAEGLMWAVQVIVVDGGSMLQELKVEMSPRL